MTLEQHLRVLQEKPLMQVNTMPNLYGLKITPSNEVSDWRAGRNFSTHLYHQLRKIQLRQEGRALCTVRDKTMGHVH